jgi:hypothetical protein
VGHLALKPLILEIDRSITDSASQMRIETVWIRGNVPSEFKGNRDVSARIALNGEEFDFDRSPATEEGGFQIRVDPNLWAVDGRHLAVRLRLEQHRLLRNAIFAGEAEFDLLEAIPEGHGLLANVYQELPIEISDGEEGPADEAATPGDGDQIGLEMVLRGKAMRNLQRGPDCPA